MVFKVTKEKAFLLIGHLCPPSNIQIRKFCHCNYFIVLWFFYYFELLNILRSWKLLTSTCISQIFVSDVLRHWIYNSVLAVCLSLSYCQYCRQDFYKWFRHLGGHASFFRSMWLLILHNTNTVCFLNGKEVLFCGFFLAKLMFLCLSCSSDFGNR